MKDGRTHWIEFSKENGVIRASEAMTFEVTEPISSVLDIS